MKRNGLKMWILALALCLCACGQEDGAAPTPPASDPARPSPAVSREESSPVLLSEVMSHNRAALMAPDGSFPDWIELYNPSDEPVSTAGLLLADSGDAGKASPLPDCRIPAGGYLLVYADGKSGTAEEPHVGFRLSDGESLRLLSRDGQVLDALELGQLEDDCALIRQGENFIVTAWPSPGYDNSPAGFDAFQRERAVPEDLRIWEVKVSPYGAGYLDTEPDSDWVELYNAGDASVSTLGFALSDDRDEPGKCPLPERILAPGQRLVIRCGEGLWDEPSIDLSLNSARESLYLSRDGQICDYVSLHDIPYDGSYGRLEGEEGFFYFARASLGAPNGGVCARQIAETPWASKPDGVFEGVEKVTVTLRGEGELHYTLDGGLPTADSPVYTEPLRLEKTCVVRAVAIREGALPSRALNLSYIINEGHTMPVVSLMGDSRSRLEDMLDRGVKHIELPGAVCLYENGQRAFSTGCGLSISGLTSVELSSKRNVKVNLRGAYGDGALNYDLFGDGIPDADSFILRAGQDSSFRLMSTEIWQELCLEMSRSVMTQHSKYCVVYVNGQYYGIYVLKENVSPGMYARWAGVSRESVLNTIPHVTDTDDYLEMYDFIRSSDLSREENYRRACELLDVDSFIDWVILEGVSGNFDLFRNVRFFRSTEREGGYQLCLFDLDNTMGNGNYTWECLFCDEARGGYFNSNASALLESLLESPQFRARFLRRYAGVFDTDLSNERILETIERLRAVIEPEIRRDRERWNYPLSSWEYEIERLERIITAQDWQNYCVRRLDSYLHLTPEEWALFAQERTE